VAPPVFGIKAKLSASNPMFLPQFAPPVFGRKITTWLANCPHYKQQNWREAEAAIQSFGTNGIPYILRHFRKGTSFWRHTHARLWLKSPVWVRRMLGPPQLQKEFGVLYAPEVFALIGPASIPALIEALKEDNPNVRKAALLALQEFGPKAKVALPALNALLAEARLRPSDVSLVKATLRRIDPEAVAAQRTNAFPFRP
jgi:hypothetical protein